jgi:chromosome segregation ATPase
MAKIETGVDRLVELINKEKKISIDDAAKQLGISKVVIQEWADFLEEEKIISIEYSFSKTLLVVRTLSKDEIKVKEKEYSTEKDAFARKVENSLKNLETDTSGLEIIKNEFNTLKKSIGSEIEKVKGEVKELEKYEYLKKNLDKDIEKQVLEFHDILDKSHKEIDSEQKKHTALLEELEIDKREVQVKEHRLLDFEEKEKELMKRIQDIVALSKDLEKKVGSEKMSLSASENKILNLEKTVRGIEDNIIKKKEEIQPLLDKSKMHEEQIIKLQNDIMEKATQKTKSIKSDMEQGNKIVSNFEKFFDKKAEIETLISTIDSEKKELEDSFSALQKKALAFEIATKSSSNTKDLEKDLEKINSKKTKLKTDLEKLIKLVKG